MTAQHDPRARMAARNNADLYEVVFAARGLAYQRSDQAFIGLDTPPPYYSQITLQAPNQQALVEAHLPALRARADGPFGFKDSFDDLDLPQDDFATLFTAQWIWRAARALPMPIGWEPVTNAGDLALWEGSWKRNGSPCEEQVFPPAFLENGDIRVFGRRDGAGYSAGCIANLSADCVGLSNVFAKDPCAAVFSQSADLAASVAPDLPVVGYEAGEALAWAQGCGFETVGHLRILISRMG